MNEKTSQEAPKRVRSKNTGRNNGNEREEDEGGNRKSICQVWHRGPNSFLPKEENYDNDKQWLLLLDRRRLKNEKKKHVNTNKRHTSNCPDISKQQIFHADNFSSIRNRRREVLLQDVTIEDKISEIPNSFIVDKEHGTGLRNKYSKNNDIVSKTNLPKLQPLESLFELEVNITEQLQEHVDKENSEHKDYSGVETSHACENKLENIPYEYLNTHRYETNKSNIPLTALATVHEDYKMKSVVLSPCVLDYKDYFAREVSDIAAYYSEEEITSDDSGIADTGNHTCEDKATERSPYCDSPLPSYSSEELETSLYLRNWVSRMLDSASNIVKELQEDFAADLAECDDRYESDNPATRIVGETDDDGELHGETEVYYENGDYFWGDYHHGVREGMANLVLKNGDTFMGRFRNNRLEGFVVETITFCDRQNVTREVFYKKGVRHGFYREMGPTKQVWAIGRFSNGRKVGTHWKWVKGDSFLIGSLENENIVYGEQCFFLYPDLTTALCGVFDRGRMVASHSVQLSGVYHDLGIPVPAFHKMMKKVTYRYEPATSLCITKNPLVRDPYEERYVYVKTSQVPFAGEGLWAKSKISKGQVVAFFNGVRQRHLCGVKSVKVSWSDYRISCEKDLDLDIQTQDERIKDYCATLAHKTCHSFNPNSCFAQCWHPRFGLIMSVVAKRDISPGEEIFVSYNYSLATAPSWYQVMWFRHIREELDWSEQKIHSWLMKIFRQTGEVVAMIPPTRESPRLVLDQHHLLFPPYYQVCPLRCL